MAHAHEPETTRLAGPDRYATAVQASTAAFPDGAAQVYLARGDDFADALAAGALRRGPVLLVPQSGPIPEAVAEEVTRLGPEVVIALGGNDAVAPEVLAQASAGRTPARLAGPDRYATAVQVSRAAFSRAGDASAVYLARGDMFADALAAASLDDGPVLLVPPTGTLPDSVADEVARLDPQRVVALGGPAAVSDAALARAADGRPSDRLAGPDRYATAAAVAVAAFPDGASDVLVARGDDFADALAAGSFADRPVLLVDPVRAPRPEARSAMSRLQPARVVVLGGEAGVREAVSRALIGALGRSSPLPQAVRDDMTGGSWRSGCPVGLDDLVLLEVVHHDFAGGLALGEMVVAARSAGDLLAVFERLYDARFPIERMRRIDDYGADDDASMADNNSSAFNCRTTTSGTAWSEHAYGTAVDLNPVQNPYVRGGHVLPSAGAAYADRTRERRGMVLAGGPVTQAFLDIGWGWGGDWRTLKDYMHFSESGR